MATSKYIFMIVFIILMARVELNTDKYNWLSLKHVRMSLMGPCHHHKCFAPVLSSPRAFWLWASKFLSGSVEGEEMSSETTNSCRTSAKNDVKTKRQG